MATATPMEGPGDKDLYDERDGKRVRYRHWLVDAVDADEVYTAAGLPQPGDAYSAVEPTLRVVSRTPVGRPSVGHTRVRVGYEQLERGGSGGAGRPRAGLVVTEFQPSVTVEQFRVERLANGDRGRTIPGDGVAVRVPELTLVVRVFYPEAQAVPDAADLFRQYAGKLNSDPVVCPNAGYAFGNLAFEPGEVLYLRPDVGREDGYRYVGHTLHCAVTHDYETVKLAADGTPGAVERYSVYERVPMAGAWPLGF